MVCTGCSHVRIQNQTTHTHTHTESNGEEVEKRAHTHVYASWNLVEFLTIWSAVNWVRFTWNSKSNPSYLMNWWPLQRSIQTIHNFRWSHRCMEFEFNVYKNIHLDVILTLNQTKEAIKWKYLNWRWRDRKWHKSIVPVVCLLRIHT